MENVQIVGLNIFRIERLENFFKLFLPLIQLLKFLRLRDGKAGGRISGNNGIFLYLIPSYIMWTRSFFLGGGGLAYTWKSLWRGAYLTQENNATFTLRITEWS
jgi:hypothetical protein